MNADLERVTARPSDVMTGLEPHYLMFLAAAVLLAVTPGPGIAYVLARTVAGGRSEGMASSIGTGVGGLAHVAASAVGLSVLLAESAWAFSIVKYAGACYLLCLGIRMLRNPAVATVPTSSAVAGCRRALLERIVTEVLNVKTALFFLAFIPQFVDPALPALGQFLLLGSICVALNTAVDVAVALGASRIMSAPETAMRRARMMNVASGSTLIGLGVYIAVAKSDR